MIQRKAVTSARMVLVLAYCAIFMNGQEPKTARLFFGSMAVLALESRLLLERLHMNFRIGSC